MMQFHALLRPISGVAIGTATGLGITALSQAYAATGKGPTFENQGGRWTGRDKWNPSQDDELPLYGRYDDAVVTDGTGTGEKGKIRHSARVKAFDGTGTTGGGSPTTTTALEESAKKYKASYEGKHGPTDTGQNMHRVEAGNVLAYTSHFPARRRSALDYTPGNLQMMKEYNMTEEEWAFEFGGRPHQQRQSPVAYSDLFKHRLEDKCHHHCSHKALAHKACGVMAGGNIGNLKAVCKHEAHEYEICVMAEAVRLNQVLQKKKKVHAMYTEAERNWLYNDPNWGHLLYRSKFGAHTLKAGWGLGAGPRLIDPPTHEATVSQLPIYNPDIIRSDPHPAWVDHKCISMGINTNAFKAWWNQAAWRYPKCDGDRSYDCTIPFCPLQHGAFMHGF